MLIAMKLQVRTARGFAILSLFFFLFVIPIERLASRESALVGLLCARMNVANRPFSIQDLGLRAYLRENNYGAVAPSR